MQCSLTSRALLTAAVLISHLCAGDSPEPVRVCAVLEDMAAYDGKVVAIVGRFSFRPNGRSLSEDKCGVGSATALPIVFEKKIAPPTPEHLELDGAAVRQLLKSVQQHTALAKFKFGTPDYDRWAVVYGRVESNKSNHPSPARIVCAGDSVVMFLVDRQ